MARTAVLGAVSLVFPLVIACAAPAWADEVLRLGFRADAPPFSYCVPQDACPGDGCAHQSAACGADGWIEGYSVRLCQWVGDALIARAAAAGLGSTRYEFVEVTAGNRFEKLASGEVDVLCGADTVTLQRLRDYRASIYTFLSGASVMYPQGKVVDGPEDLAGLDVGVLGNTTTMRLMEKIQANGTGGAGFTIRPTGSHMEAVDLLQKRTAVIAPAGGGGPAPEGIDVYFADREILLWLLRDPDLKSSYEVSAAYFSVEPYALFMKADAAALQYEVNLALVELYADHREALVAIFARSFGRASPSSLLKSMFDIRPLRVEQ
jgi:ABC-type amino acid transport substrate-binding protein